VRGEYRSGEGRRIEESAAVGILGGDGDHARAEVSEDLQDALADESVNVEVSRVDRDPYGIVVLEGSQVEGMKI
jgi:hypothetical protein